MQKAQPESKQQLNFNVFNALNLHHPLLGEAYANSGWSPLEDDFDLNFSFIEKYLQNARFKPEDVAPTFLEDNPKNITENFSLAQKRNKQIINNLQQMLDKGEFENYQGANITPQIKDIMFFLQCRQKMLEISINQLKLKSIGAFSAYKNINSINKKLSQLLEETYQKEFSQKVVLQNLIMQAQLEHKMHKQSQHTYSEEFQKIISGALDFSKHADFIPDGLQQATPENLQTMTKLSNKVKQNIIETSQQFEMSSNTKQPAPQQTYTGKNHNPNLPERDKQF